jgi:hypothetical protein
MTQFFDWTAAAGLLSAAKEMCAALIVVMAASVRVTALLVMMDVLGLNMGSNSWVCVCLMMQT